MLSTRRAASGNDNVLLMGYPSAGIVSGAIGRRSEKVQARVAAVREDIIVFDPAAHVDCTPISRSNCVLDEVVFPQRMSGDEKTENGEEIRNRRRVEWR